MRAYKSHKEYKKEALKDPELKAEYDALEPEFKMALSMIDARVAKKTGVTKKHHRPLGEWYDQPYH